MTNLKDKRAEMMKVIDDESIVVDEYSGHSFEHYYFHEDQFYFFDGINYRLLKISETKKRYKFVTASDVDGKYVKIYYHKFKTLYGLI